MHILFVESGYPKISGRSGGAGSYVKNYSTQLIEMGHEVSVLCDQSSHYTTYFQDNCIHVYPFMGSGPIHYYISKIPIIRVFALLIRYLESGWKTHKQIRKIDEKKIIDIIEYTEGGDFWNAIFKKFNYIVHLHGSAYTIKKATGQIVCRSDWYKRKAELFFISRAPSIVSPSIDMKELVEAESRKIFKNLSVIPYPIDPQIEINGNLSHFNKSCDNVTILFASRNDPLKGGEILINAIQNLSVSIQKVIDVQFYGYQPSKNSSIPDCITINDFLPRNEFLKVYQYIDICVVPSYYDNSPNVIYESMARGKIVIASKVGGIPEIIADAENGYLFDIHNINDFTKTLTKAIDLVLSGNDIQIRKNAQEKIMSISNNEKNVQKRLKLLQE